MAAMLLDGFGELERIGLTRGHADDNESAEFCGCGVQATWDRGRSIWDPDAFLDEAEETGLSRLDICAPDGTGEAPRRYWLAAFGGVWEQLGWLWDRCPHWYVEHASPRARAIVSRVMQLRRMAKMGVQVTGLTAAGQTLLASCDQYWNHLQSVQDERRMREARDKAKSK